MKVITSKIPERYLCSMMLYVSAGSFMDGEDRGISHVAEHMLVVYDKRRSLRSRSIYEITAHTSYEYMIFIIKYDGRILLPREVKRMLQTIASGRTLDWTRLEECKEDVLKEIEFCRQGQVSVLECTGETGLIPHLPLGESQSVQCISKEKLESYISEIFREAKKKYISVTPSKGNQYKIRIQPMGNHLVYRKAVMESLIQKYIFQDILYIICKTINQKENALAVQMYSIRNQNYIVFTCQEYKKRFQCLLFDKKQFLKTLVYLRYQYIGVYKFDMNNMNQLVAASIQKNLPLYQARELRKVLYWTRGKKLYPRYTEYVRSLSIIVKKEINGMTEQLTR